MEQRKEAPIDLHLHPKQHLALTTKATELLYGGAAGGGKSHAMRVASIVWCSEISGLQVYLFRRIEDDLVKNHVEGPKGYRALLASWVEAGLVKIVDTEIRFWNGSKIYLCHCKDEAHRFKYQGAEIHVLMIDEATHFTDTIYRFLRSRVRAPGLKVPRKYWWKDADGEDFCMFPRILLGSNPGNIGHQWVKGMFIDPTPAGEMWVTPDEEGGMIRQFIPARLVDNPTLETEDPNYRLRLRGLGAELARAMEEGDWSVIAGAFFPEIGPIHRLKPFPIPEDWLKFRSVDWGSRRPFSVGWWAVCDGSYEYQDADKNFVIPRGALIRYREWYGCKGPNEGLKLHAPAVADGIVERTAPNEKITYTVCDPAMFAEDGGPSIAETFAKHGVQCIRGDNKRQPGWEEMRARLMGDDHPMLYVFETCIHWWRTVPALQHDELKPEDVDTDLEDHAGDETRYGCASRPWIRKVEKRSARTRPTLNELLAVEPQRATANRY